MKKLVDKSAIVTGAGGGIGGAISRLLAAEGARVACVDVDAAAAEKTANRISELGGEAIVCHSDVSNGKGAESAVRAALEAFGAVQILVRGEFVLTRRPGVRKGGRNAFPK